jgi:hypothetical protein
MKKFFVAAAITVSAVGVVAGPAAAGHLHRIETPGACVDRNGQGFGGGEDHETGLGAGVTDPGDTSFHERLHAGTPGQFAFKQQNNVSIIAGVCPEEPVTPE